VDFNLTGHANQPDVPARPAGSGPGGPRGARSRTGLAVTIAVAVVLIALSMVVVGTGLLAGSSASASPLASPVAVVPSSPSPTATTAPTPTPSPIPTPTPAPTAPPLPALLGAIGDSYSQAWSVSPAYPRDHTQFSWVIGTDKNVNSLLARFRALGATPTVVDAATSGKTMADANRQAQLVVAAAGKLAPGRTAYVTFELGTNDLCASPDPMTDPSVFENQLRSAIATLRAGLPAGSRILMLPVPDFPHFRDITQANAAAKANLAEPANLNRCAPYLGLSSPTALAAGDYYLAQYDAALKRACDDIDANEGATGRLNCAYAAGLLAGSDFVIGDLSTADYFHPSISGQARLAASAWRTGVWAAPPAGS
jgi:lysophospholipase L1-like esterase